jgi:hypothetical protein
MLSKLGIVEEECDESIFWLEVLADSRLSDNPSIDPLCREANEILAMTVASIRTLKTGRNVGQPARQAMNCSEEESCRPPASKEAPRESEIRNPRSEI